MKAVLYKDYYGGSWRWQILNGSMMIAEGTRSFKTRTRCWNALRALLNVKKLEIETVK